jgi:hypothetical protein
MDWSIIFLIFIGIIIFNIVTEKKHIIQKKNITKKKIFNIILNTPLKKKNVNFSGPEFTILNIPPRPQINNDNIIPEPINDVSQTSEFTSSKNNINLSESIQFEKQQNSVSLEAFASPKQSYNLL